VAAEWLKVEKRDPFGEFSAGDLALRLPY